MARTIIVPGILSQGFLNQVNRSTNTGAGVSILKDSFLDSEARGIIHMKKGVNADNFVGSSTVSVTGVEAGLPMEDKDILVAEVIGRTATKFFSTSTVTTDSYLTMEVG